MHSPIANIGAHNPDLLGYAKQVTARKHLNVTALMQIYWVRAALSEGPLQRVGREPADGTPLRQQITIFVWQLHAHVMDQMVEGASASLDQVCCPTGACASPAHALTWPERWLLRGTASSMAFMVTVHNQAFCAILVYEQDRRIISIFTPTSLYPSLLLAATVVGGACCVSKPPATPAEHPSAPGRKDL